MPPFQPEGDEDEEPKALRQCFGYPMLWPESQIRLGAGSTAPRITPPVVPGPSHVVPDPDPDMQMAQDPNDDDDDVNVEAYINTAYCDGLDDLDQGPSDKRQTITKRLSFHSQETPPDAAWTEPPRGFISPTTLHKVVEKQNAIPMKKKERKRKNKKEIESQPPPVTKPIRAQDGPPRHKGLNHIVHTMGEPMLNERMLKACSADMRSLHDSILYLEQRQLDENDSTYPLYMAKVPKGKGFVEAAPADIMLLRFADIFDLFHMYRLYQTFVRLFSLSIQMQIIRDKTPGIVVVDPYYMRESQLSKLAGRNAAINYLSDVMTSNIGKDLLLAYFPE
jgi:hypothetical protein